MVNRHLLDEIALFKNTVSHYFGWIVFGSILFSTIGVTGLLLLPDHYKATTTILVDPQKVPEKYVSPTVSSDPAQRLSTITQQVLSSTRLQQIIDELNLYPELRGRKSREEIIETMRQYIAITVKQGSSSGLSAFSIEYEGHQADVVATVANKLADSFINWNVRSREQESQDTTDFLNAQLELARENLEDQEKKLSAFKLRHLGEMPDQESANLQVLSQLQGQFQANADELDRLETERTMLLHGAGASSASEQGKDPEAAERIELQDEQEKLQGQLNELRRRYTDEFPGVTDTAARLKRVTEQIALLTPASQANSVHEDTPIALRLEAVEKESNRLNSEQSRITSETAAYRTKVEDEPIREQEMAELNRNYSVSKDHYQSLLDKAFQAKMASDLEQKQEAEHFTVLDLATVPEKPFKPQRRILLPVVLLAAVALSILLAYLRDILRGSPRIERELRAMLPADVPVLTNVPRMVVASDRRRSFRLALASIAVLVAGCALNVAVFLKFHPKI
jgi:polysaccharide biosynthesis transport protein